MKVGEEGKSISAETYLSLRASILSGTIAPGAKVTTPELCKTFGASTGAVREALSRLRAEGLISAETHRGFSVASISIDDLRDLTRSRIDIEMICLSRSIERGGDQWEANLVAAAHMLARAHKSISTGYDSGQPFLDAHRAFHYALVAACDSPRMLRLRQQLAEEGERYRVIHNTIVPNRNAAEEHRLIAEATLERDTKRARSLLTQHIEQTATAIIGVMVKAA